MRSSNGAGMFRLFAVHTNITSRQVEVDFEVVVVERRVLLRVEHFEQRRRRIAAEVHRHLVDFVEQEQRIVHAGLRPCSARSCRASSRCRCGDGRGSRPRRARRRATCARTCDSWRARSLWPSEVLPTPGGPTRHRIGPLSCLHALLDGEVLDDAFLDLLQPVVIFVQHLLGAAMSLCTLVRLLPRAPSPASRCSCARPWLRPTSATSA